MSAKTQAQKAYNRYKQAQKNQKKKKVVTTQTQQQEKTNQAVTRRATGNYSSFKGRTYYSNPGRTSEGSVQTTTSKRYTQEEAPARRNQQELQRQRREHQTQTTGQRMSSEDQSRFSNLTKGALEQSVGSARKAFSGFMSGVTENRAKGDTYGGVQAHRNGTQRYMTRRDDRLSPEQLKTKETDIQKSKVTSHALDVAAEKYTKEESKAASKQIARGTEKIEKGKEGLGAVGSFGADLYTGAVQLGADIGIGALTGSALLPMGVRAFGGAVDEAEKAGASWKKQMMYGATTAGIELGTEKLFNVGAALNKAYGAGVGDKLVDKLTKKVGKSALKGGLSEVGAAALTEGLEEMVAEGLEPMVANAIYANAIGGDAVQTSLLNNPTQAGLNILRAGGIGAALGAPLGGAGIVMQNYQGKKISENAQNIYGEDGVKEMARQARESEDEGDAAFAQAVYNAINEGKGVANIQVAKLQGVLNSQKKRDAERTVDAYNAAEREIANNNYSTPRQAANAKASESVEVARRAIAENIPADVEMSEAETNRIVTTAARIGSGVAGESDIRGALSSAESITVMEAVTGLDLGGKSKTEQHDMLIQYAANQYVDTAKRQTEYDNSTLKNAYKTIKEKDLGVGGQTAFDTIFEEEDVRGLADGQTDFRGEDINDVHNKMYTFEKFYLAGTANMTLEEIRQKDNPVFASLTPQQQEDAYIAGRNDALAEQNAAYLKDVQVGRKSKKAGTKVRPGHVTLARLSDENKRILTQSRPLFEALAKALGIEIEFRDEITNVNGEIIEEGVNGHYQDGKITISMDNDKADMSKVPLAAIAYVFEHEVTHHMKVFAPAEFFRFKQFVKNKMMTMDSSDGNFANRYEEEIAKKRRQYGNEDVDLLFEEILADATIEFIQDEEFCKEICEQDADTAHAIVKAIRNLMDKIREIMANIVLTDSQRQTLFSELDILKDAEQMWLDGIRVAAERRNAVGEPAGGSGLLSRKKVKAGDRDSVKQQIRNNLKELNKMPVAVEIETEGFKGKSDATIVNEVSAIFNKSGNGVHRQDFGFISLEKGLIDDGMKYFNTDAERAALLTLPRVLKRGIIIRSKDEHKSRGYGTVTIAAPVSINGKRGNVGVVVSQTKGNRYKVLRILDTDGSVYEFETRKTETTTGSMTNNAVGEGLPIVSASNIIGASDNKVKKSRKDLVTLSDQRIDNLIDEYAIPGNTTSNYSKAWITSINPRDFLKLTISDEELEKWTLGSTNVWGQEVRELEPEDLKAKGKYDPLMPFLKVNSFRSHSVISHEGRHRMLALLRAGYEDVPVVIYDTSESAKSSRQYEERFDLWSQDHGDGPVNSNRRDEEGELGYTVDVYDLIPINEKNRAEIERMYGGDTEVQFSRKYTPEEQQEHRDMLLGECREFYGAATTEDYKESGYILPDGRMPKMGDMGIRGEDHIMAGTAYDDLWGSSAQNQFISEGNIRFTPEILGFEMSQEPTEEQYDRIRKIIDDVYADPTLNMVADGIRIDFTDEDGRVLDIQVFNGTSAEGIIGSIKAHFAGGTVTPMRQFLSRKDSEGRYLSEGQMEYFKDSKARDAYGHLIPVYHSSDAEFTEFDEDRRGESTGSLNTAYGFFTSPNEEFSKQFGKNTRKMYANITRPIIHPSNCHLKYPGREDDITRTWFETVDPYQIPFLEEIVDSGDYDNIYDAYMGAFIWEAFDYADDERQTIENAGFDGIEIIEGENGEPISSFVVFNSNQLKDVDNLDPTDNPDIMMSRKTDSDGNALSQNQVDYFSNSKVRDDKGNLLRMYHGTNEKFNVFKASEYIGEQNGQSRIKGYFSTSEDYSSVYGETTAYYLNMENPLFIPDEWKTLDEWKKWFAEQGVEDVVFDSSIANDGVKGYGNPDGTKGYALWDLFDIGNNWNDDGNLTERIESAGFDGIYWSEGEGWNLGGGKFVEGNPMSYMPFDENAIKRVDNLNPTESEDVRYSRKETEPRGNKTQQKRDRGEKLTESQFYRLYSVHKLNMLKHDNVQEQIENIKEEGFKGDGGQFGHNVLPASVNNGIKRYTEQEMRERGFSEEKIERIKQSDDWKDGVFWETKPNITQDKYGGRKGDTVMFVSAADLDKTTGTDRVQMGYKPFDYEIVTVERDFQPYYELYDKAYDKTKEEQQKEFDDSGNIIPLSQRFNRNSDDMRYSLKTVKPVQPSSNAWTRGATFAEVKSAHPTLFELQSDDVEEKNPTSIGSTVSTYRKIYDMLKDEGFRGTVLDASSGIGKGTEAGRSEYGFAVEDIEPFPPDYYEPMHKDYSALHTTYDAIISNAVLNVLPQDERDNLIVKMGELLKPGGKMFINVRGKDVTTNKSNVAIDEANMEYFVESTGSYQKGFTPKELKAYVEDALGSDYTVTTTNKFGAVSVIVEKSDEDLRAIEDAGLFVSDGGSVSLMSRKSWEETDKKKLKDRLLKAGFEEDEIESWMKEIDTVAAIIGEDAARLDYIAARQHSFKKPDGDYYKYTLDSSTLCAKRLLYQGTYDAIMHVLKDVPLMENDVIRIRQMMAERMHEVPCGICYVESQRKTLGRYASEWLKDYKGDYVPSLDEVVSTDGLEWLRTEHPQTYEDFTKAMSAKGVSSPKVVQLRTDYREDLVRMTAATVEYLNKIGGLRWNSFSDFETPHLIDFMQATLDMSAKGLMGMAYTKVPNLVKVFGGTGVKFNLSLIPKVDENGNVEHDADGHIVFDDVEGMSIEDAMELRDKYPDNVATILVAKDKAHMLEAMNDDRVDFIIPFHRSKWTMAEFEKLGLKGYEDFATGDQENPIFPSEYWDYSITQKKGGGRKNAETYLKLCAERGEKPAFSKLLVDNGDGSYSLPKGNSKEATTIRNGYYKLIIEGKMFNHKTGKGAPQQKVKMNIDMDAAREVLAEYDGDPNALPVAEDVVRDFVKEKTGRDVKLSRKVSDQTEVSPLDEEYLAVVTRGDMETAQRMVNEAAARAGYIVRAYHGTSSYGFNEFRKGVSQNGYARNRNVFGYGYYFSDVRDVAEHYAKPGGYIDKETGEIVEFTPGVYDVFLNPGNTISVDWQSEIRPLETQAEFDAYMDEKWEGRDSISVRNVNDGVPITSTVYVVKNPEQIKSAEPVVYDDNGEVIPLSERFNTENNDIRYSRKETVVNEDEVSDVMASDPTIVDTMYGWGMATPEGQNLHEQTKDELIAKIEKLKQDMTITDGKVLDEKSVCEEMNKLVVNMGIEEDRWTGQMLGEVKMNKTNRGLVEDLVQTAKTIWKELQNENYEAAAISAMNVSEHVVDNLLLTEDTMYKEYKELVDYLKNTKWELNPIYHGDFADGFVEFKKEYRGKIRIVKSGGRSPDELWGEMCDLWPEFFTEDITNPAEMMKRMAEVRDSLDPYSAMLSEENQQLILRDAAADIIEIVSNGKPLETWADKRENYYREKIARLKARQQEAIRDIKEKQNWKDAERKLAAQMAEGKKKAKQQREKQENKEKKSDDKGKRQTIGKITKQLDWLSGRLLKPSDDKHLPEGYRNVVAQMLAAIDPQTERSKALEEKYGVSKKRFKWLQLRSEYERIASGESYGFILDDQIMADMQELSDVLGDGDFALANMTYDELQKVYRIVRSIRHGIQMQNKMFSDELKGRAEDYGRNAIETAETYIDKHGTDRKGVAGKIHGSGMPLLDEGMLTPRDYFEYIGGGLNEAFLAMRRGQDEQIKKINYMRSFFESIFRDYGKTTRVRHRAKPGSELEAWRDGKNKKSFQCEGGTIELTPSQVMSLYCLMKREQAQGHILGSGIKAAVVNKKNLLLGENLKEFFTGKGDKKTRGRRVSVTAEDIMNIVGSLTEEQRDIADKMQTLMSTVMSDWGNEASMKMFGYRKFTEENYFPIECESTYLATDFDVRQTAERVKNPNFAKSTQKGANNPVVIDDIFSVCADHCNRMAMYSSYAPAIADFQRVYNFVDRDPETGLQNGSVKESLQAAYGDRALKYIERFMTDLNGTTPTTHDDLNRFVAKSLANYKKAAIGGNLRVAVQQPTAMIRALLYISPKYFMGKMSPVKEIREMKEHCPIALWKSWGFSQVDMARDLEDIMMNQEWSRFDMLTMEIYNFLDLVTWGQIWRAVKNEVKAEHKDVEVGSDEFYRLCNERASYIFDKSQVVDSVFHKSQVMRNTDVMSKMLTSFMAEPTRTFNMVGSEIQRAAKMWQDGDKAGAMKVYGKAFNVFILNAATVSAAAAVVDMMRGKGGDDDDDDDKLSLIMHNFIENMKSNALPHTFIPGVSDVVELFTDSWGAKNMSLEGYEKLAKAVKDMFDEDKTWPEKIKGLVENGGYVFGIPTKNIMRELQTALDILGIEVHAAEETDEVEDVKLTDKFFGMFKGEDKKSEKKSEKKEEDEEEEEELEDYIDTTNKHGLIDKALRKMDFEEGGTIDNFLDKHGLTMTDAEARERAVNEKVEKVMAKGEGKSGEEKDKAIWKATTEKYTKYLDQGDMDTIKEMREVYTKAGGDGAYFDEKVLGKMKSSYKKTIGEFDKLSEQEDMKNYMLDKGMTEEEISSEIVYKSDTAKKFAIAAQEGKDAQAIACLVSLYMAGMTDADAQKLYENRWRYGNGKNKAGHGTGQFSWPCSGRISSYFGRRNAPTAGASSNHPSIDIAVSSGTTVCAADGGVVIYTGYNGGYGNSVGIDHGNGYVTYYNHLSQYNVQKGQMIRKGQPVALSGNTGTSTGPHLDFKILKDGSPVDPMKYLN